jgi:predicted CXXCH cytochrome family protein
MYTSLLLLVTLVAQPAPAAAPKADETEICLSCHGDKTLAVTLASGEVRSLYVDQQGFAHSVHGSKLGCTDCHAGMTEVPHAARPFKTLREFTVAYYDQCKRCHFKEYTKTLDSVHFQALARGDRTAPVCVDCHGAHGITPPGTPRTQISATCAKCHQGVSVAYAKSVHGSELARNGDVPVCTDCHQTHDVGGPKEQGWRLRTPEICASCHANQRLMSKYGLSTAVQRTYLADFHGMTSKAQGARPGDAKAVVALCTDCHGVHDITRVKDPNSRVLKANLVKTCSQCHQGISDNFPGAWLSHYEPSLKKAPLVYFVQVFYNLMIPFMMVGLVLQILLHFWRVVVNR